jgi:hypothetical protein
MFGTREENAAEGRGIGRAAATSGPAARVPERYVPTIGARRLLASFGSRRWTYAFARTPCSIDVARSGA